MLVADGAGLDLVGSESEEPSGSELSQDVSLDAALLRCADDVTLDGERPVSDDDEPVCWVWVRCSTLNPKREVWEKFFAPEAPHDGLDYRVADGPEVSDPPPARPLSEALASAAESLPDILTVGEVATFLRINPKTAYEKTKHDEIPGALRIGGAIRVSKAALLAAFSDPPKVKSRNRR